MTKKLEVYKCEICGNIVEMLHEGDGTLVCCGANMRLIEANTVDASKEKHVPVVEKTDDGLTVKVGEVPHPMEEKHYIEWIQVITKDQHCSGRTFLKPGDVPEAKFPKMDNILEVREYCNVHGLWTKKM